MKSYFINNELVQDCSLFAVSDRAVCYGDGVFETLKYIQGGIPFVTFHLKRLEHACSALRIALVLDDINTQIALLVKALQENEIFSGVIRIMVCREGLGRGSYLPKSPSSKVLLSYQPLPAENFQGKKIELIASTYLMSSSVGLAGIKHMSRLEYVCAELALSKPIKNDQELLILDAEQRVVETIHHNIFLRSEGSVFTPNLTRCGVKGVMRQWVMENIAPRGFSLQQGDYDIGFLDKVDEVFITNAIQGIVSVSKFRNKTFKNYSLAASLQAVLQQKFKFYES